MVSTLARVQTASCLALALFCTNPGQAATPNGRWQAQLETPGGALRFGLKLVSSPTGWKAHLINGPEMIEIPHVRVEGTSLVINFTHYDSRIEAQYDTVQDVLKGTWTKRRGIDKLATLSFSAARKSPDATPPLDKALDALLGKWAVDFSSEDAPAVGQLQRNDDGTVWGTFLTTVGDYRFLTAAMVSGQLELSCFDGAHAFLMRAKPQEDGSLEGEFWSGDWWHETWTANRDETIQLPNAFELSEWNQNIALADLQFPDLDGNPRKLIGPEEEGKALILEIFGSWCPNCHDAGRYLAEIDDEYRDRGLRVIGLAFELTGDLKRDAEQVRQYQRRHNFEFPAYICGLSNKQAASAAFPALDQIRAYPTFVFVDRSLQVRAVYTGFSGPATGAEHERLRERFEQIIEEMLK